MKPSNAPFFLLSLAMIIVDQVSKWAADVLILRVPPLPDFWTWLTQPGPRLPFSAVEITPYFNIVMVWNFGVSFGTLNYQSAWGAVILSSLAVVLCLIFSVWLMRTHSRIIAAALALVIGGAMGNVIDRMRMGAVMDFLDFHVAGWHWPAFNVADSCICIGVGILLFHARLWKDSRHDPELLKLRDLAKTGNRDRSA
ncbi:MAG: signal peptidase II [Alphaproteobacteria bacterium]|nr:signal peptidase II [Alphaproteobacteria bacterium]